MEQLFSMQNKCNIEMKYVINWQTETITPSNRNVAFSVEKKIEHEKFIFI